MPLIGFGSCGQTPARRGASDARGQIYIIPSLYQSARALGAQIVDRGYTRAKNTSGWPLVMLSNSTSARSCTRGEDRGWLYDISAAAMKTYSTYGHHPTSPYPALDRCSLLYHPHISVAIQLHLSSMLIPDSHIYPAIYHSRVHLPIIFSIHSASVTLSRSRIPSRVDISIHPSRLPVRSLILH